jgi:hypothetical protein
MCAGAPTEKIPRLVKLTIAGKVRRRQDAGLKYERAIEKFY